MSEKNRKSTIVTIAKAVGVSPSTVSRAFDPTSRISDPMRERIFRCAQEQDYVPNRAASRLPMKTISIGLLMNDFYEPATVEFLRGINDGYRELRDLKIHFESCIIGYSSKTVAELENALERFRGFDGLVVSGFIDPEETVLLNRYYRHNPNLVLLQNDIPGVGRLSVSYHDPGVASRLAAEFIADCLRKSESKNVVLFTGERKWQIHGMAAEAFHRAAKENGLNIVGSYDMKDSSDVMNWQLYDIYVKQGIKPDGIFITSGKSLDLCRYIKDKNLSSDTVLVTYDVTKEIADYIKQGVVLATVYQNFYNQAKSAFVNLVRHILGEKTMDETLLQLPELVFGSNVDFYLG